MIKIAMHLSKVQKIEITGIIVTIILAGIAIGYQHYYSDRPILSISLGLSGYPQSALHKEGSNYNLGISVENTGKRDGKIFFILRGTNVKISSDKNGPWAYEERELVKIPPHSPRVTPLYLLPDDNVSMFTVKLSLDDSQKEFLQETNILGPDTLQYERTDSHFFLVSSSHPPTLERAPASAPRIVDVSGNAITGAVKVGQQIQIVTDLTNGQDRDQPFAYIMQIQDSNGVTVSLSWITGTMTSGQSANPAQSWIPKAAGKYTVQIFVWQSLTNPNALSPPMSTRILVQ